MRIWLDPDRMANMQISPDRGHPGDPAGERPGRRRQDRRPAGPAPGRTFELPDHASRGGWRRSSEFEEIIVRRNDDGSIVRLKDVARVELSSENYETAGYLDGKPAGSDPDLPVRRRQRPGHRRAGPRARWTGSRRASRRGSSTGSPTTRPTTCDENINEVEHTLDRGVRPGHDRRVRLPPGLPGHDHPDAGDPGLAGRHVRGDGRLRVLDQHADAVRAGPGDRPGGRRRDHRGRERREVPRARPARRWRRPGRRWPRSRRRS